MEVDKVVAVVVVEVALLEKVVGLVAKYQLTVAAVVAERSV